MKSGGNEIYHEACCNSASYKGITGLSRRSQAMVTHIRNGQKYIESRRSSRNEETPSPDTQKKEGNFFFYPYKFYRI